MDEVCKSMDGGPVRMLPQWSRRQIAVTYTRALAVQREEIFMRKKL